MKKQNIYNTLRVLFCFAILMYALFVPQYANAQVEKTCTTAAECAGPEPMCVPVDTNNPTQGGKRCRNIMCQSSSVKVFDKAGVAQTDNVLEAGGYVEITSTAKLAVNSFMSAFYNNEHHYPSDPNQGNGTPRGISVVAAHTANMKNTAGQASTYNTANADGTYPLVFSENANGTTHVMKLPYSFFLSKDQTLGINQYATSIQINSYFGMTNPNRFSVPEAACVSYITFDPSSSQCGDGKSCPANQTCSNGTCVTGPTAPPTDITKAPANSTCPSNSACNVNKKCACETGFYNCDNNWTNGCESANKCSTGGVCSTGSQCLSGVCLGNMCQPTTCGNQTCQDGQVCENNACRVPAGGACTNDDDCAGGNICDNGKCVSKQPAGGSCQEDSDCAAGNSCNNGKCMPNYCDATHACPAGYSCKQGTCFPGTCGNGKVCPNGYTCDNTSKQCLPGTCKSDTPCPPGYLCSEGKCVGGIGNGSCDVAKGDADCKANGQCVNGSCFCKAGTYNCDRDWADGCESTSPCAGSGTARLNMKLKFSGIGANLPPVSDSLKVKVTLANKYLLQPLEREVDFVISGQGERGIRIFSANPDFTDLPMGGGYSIFVKGNKHIQKRVCDNRPTETVDGRYNCSTGNITLEEGTNELDFSNIYQLGGDIPVSNEQSGFVDAVDITYLRANLGSKDADKLLVGDLNLDGIVDTQDYSLALYTLSFKYDEVITGEEN